MNMQYSNVFFWIIKKYCFISAPSRPRNLTATRITNNSVKLKWLEPENSNGVLQGYNIYHLDVGPNHTERKKVLNPQKVMEYVLGSLSK